LKATKIGYKVNYLIYRHSTVSTAKSSFQILLNPVHPFQESNKFVVESSYSGERVYRKSPLAVVREKPIINHLDMNRIRVMAKPNPRAMKPKIPIIHSLSCGIHPSMWNSIPITESCKMSFRAY
jgi:hypothetical protein